MTPQSEPSNQPQPGVISQVADIFQQATWIQEGSTTRQVTHKNRLWPSQDPINRAQEQ